MTCSAVTFFPYTQSKKVFVCRKTRFGGNGRQTKNSPEKGDVCLFQDCFLL